MAEIALTNAEADARSGATDSDVDLTYPTIGESPYHTTMYRLLDRLLTVAKAVNELRPYKDGDLTVGVRAGSASAGAAVHTYAGASGRTLSDDASNYLYLLVNGASLDLTINTTGFPDAAATPHLPLAVIHTGSASAAGVSGQYAAADICDVRGRALFKVVGA